MVLILMGVTGAGKTTIGKMLAAQLDWQFADADQFHPASNLEKMRQGIALTDEDREPWLAALRAQVARWIADRLNVVLACSALKQSYRETLQVGPDMKFVFLKGSPALIASRVRARKGHFAGESILASQFADLEEPRAAFTVDVADAPEQLVTRIRQGLHL